MAVTSILQDLFSQKLEVTVDRAVNVLSLFVNNNFALSVVRLFSDWIEVLYNF